VTTTFSVPDMTCGHCEKAVRSSLGDVLPDAEVNVDLGARTVCVTGNAATAEEAIREAGYTPERLG
jgi:copper chaperone